MRPESNAMVEFFERLGHKVIQSENAWWYDVAPRVLLSFPYYKLIEPSEEEVDELLHKHKLRALRYPTTLNAFGFVSTLELNRNPNYDLSCLHPTARRQTRQGLKNCVVKEIDFDYLMRSGLSLNRDTAQRQGRESQYADPTYWHKYCQAAKETHSCIAWGATVKGNLASYLIAVVFDGWVNCLLSNSSIAFLDKRPSNALLFHVTRHYLKDIPNTKICYGIGSLEDLPNLERFKKKMGWELMPIKQRLIFSKRLCGAISLVPESCFTILNKIFPKSYNVRKATGMIRLYRQQAYDAPTSGNG